MYYSVTQIVDSIAKYEEVCKQYNIISSLEDMSFDLTREKVYIKKEVS